MVSTSNLSEQNKILSSIDALKAVLEKFPDGECQNDNSYKPIPFLLEILQHCGVTQDMLVQWLVKYIKYVLPVIELAVKGILLSNLKSMVSCSVDPMIPAYARDGEHNYNSGMTFDLNQIDCMCLLESSPLIDTENQLYFGIDRNNENKTPYDFLRPKDFNTFLWYVITRGRYPMPTIINGTSEYSQPFKEKFNAANVIGNNIFQITDLNYNLGSVNTGIIVGNSFKETIENRPLNGLSVCSSAERDAETGQIVKNTIIPVSNSWDRTNYYVNRLTYFNFIDPTGSLDESNPRDFNKDIALCSFKYVDEISNDDKKIADPFYLKNKINIKILPKPFIHIPHIGQSCLLPKKILFDNEGNPNSNGRFSVIVDGECILSNNGTIIDKNSPLIEELKDFLTKKDPSEKISGYTKNEWYWCYKLRSTDGQSTEFFLVIDKEGGYTISTEMKPKLLNENEKKKFLLYLRECYCNLTIYEFNYDYIMSMRLYDAEVVATQLINEILNFKLGFKIGVKNVDFEGQERIISLVRKIVEADDYESSDCFYTFSNDEYDEMSRDAELKRANLGTFGDCGVDISSFNDEITNLLNKFGDASTLQESVETFTNVIESISSVIEQEGSDGGSELKLHGTTFSDLIYQIIENLVLILVNSLLSPKVLLMIMVNREMCGQPVHNLTIKEIIQQMIGIISQIVKELVELIIQELFKFVLSQLKEILVLLMSKLLLEQVENFRRLVKKLIDECWFSFGKQAQLPTELDVVNYADIDTNQQQIKNEKC